MTPTINQMYDTFITKIYDTTVGEINKMNANSVVLVPIRTSNIFGSIYQAPLPNPVYSKSFKGTDFQVAINKPEVKLKTLFFALFSPKDRNGNTAECDVFIQSWPKDYDVTASVFNGEPNFSQSPMAETVNEVGMKIYFEAAGTCPGKAVDENLPAAVQAAAAGKELAIDIWNSIQTWPKK